LLLFRFRFRSPFCFRCRPLTNSFDNVLDNVLDSFFNKVFSNFLVNV